MEGFPAPHAVPLTWSAEKMYAGQILSLLWHFSGAENPLRDMSVHVAGGLHEVRQWREIIPSDVTHLHREFYNKCFKPLWRREGQTH